MEMTSKKKISFFFAQRQEKLLLWGEKGIFTRACFISKWCKSHEQQETLEKPKIMEPFPPNYMLHTLMCRKCI